MPPQDLWGGTEQAFRASWGGAPAGGAAVGVGLPGVPTWLNPPLSPRAPGSSPPGGPALSVGQLSQRDSL
ncbi:hypothetical protein D623_10009620 [Myotis brandtii]|uniref:Uncharacterized protein n=1 Tax=Myotis brandtii TaxID=109478 RepID=S7PQS4_MYOBR|nr:hypothetical protein D623_10009620 [Myotis brandtii]